MEELQGFFVLYGWQLGLIALGSVIILGILKYSNAFKKVKKENRKPIYFAISVGFSLVGAIIYLLCIKQFEVSYVITFATAIYTLNQAMYAVYETTKLKDLVAKILDIIKLKIQSKPTTNGK